MSVRNIAIGLCILLVLASVPPVGATDTTSSVGVKEKNCTLDIDPALNVSAPPGSSSNGFFNVSALYPGNLVLNVTLTRQGSIASWITFSGENSTNVSISPGKTRLMNLTVSPPGFASLGLYFANITAETGDGQIQKMNLTVNVSQDVGRIGLFVNDTIGVPVEGASVSVWYDTYLMDSGATNSSGRWLSSWLAIGNYSVEVSKTGYFTQSENVTIADVMNTTNVTMTLVPNGTPVLDASPNSISASAYTGKTATKILTIMNIGDATLDDINITGPGWMSFSVDFIDYITQGSFETVDVYMSSSTAGTRNGNIVVTSANDGNETIPVTFVVSDEEEGGDGGGGIGGIGPPLPTGVADINITKYEPVLEIKAGKNKTASVTVENSGNLTLTSITLSMSGVDFGVAITPDMVGSLEEGKRALFLVEIHVPNGTAPGDYTATLTADSAQASDTESITIKVIKPSVIPEVIPDFLSEIEDLEKLADEVWREAVLVEAEGINVTMVFDLLKDAKGSLTMARSYLAKEQYNQTGDSIEDARDYIREAVDKLGKSRPVLAECPLIDVMLLGVCGVWWVVSVISGSVVFAMIYLIRLSRTKPYSYTPKQSVKADVRLIMKKLEKKGKKKGE